jgi:hypothetical protein
MKNFPMQKLRQAAKKSPQAKNLWVWEKSQASRNYIRGVIKGRRDTDGLRALYFILGALTTMFIFLLMRYVI